MKLKNKKTGEIKEVIVGGYPVSGKTKMWKCSEMDANEESGYKTLGTYSSLAELNAEWEDYEDELFYIVSADHKDGYICALKEDYKELCDTAKELGIGFETEKEARKAVEKLKAWKRLNAEIVGWSFSYDLDLDGCGFNDEDIVVGIKLQRNTREKDLNLLFGGEE